MQAATEPNGQQQAAQSVASASVSLQARLKQEEQRKTPNVARSGLGISIRHPRPEAGTGSTEAAPSVAPVVRQEPEEDYLVTERDVNFYWLEFAGKLPHEQVAMTRRMQNMQAKLLADGVTFEVVVDNEIVAKEFTALAPRGGGLPAYPPEEPKAEDGGARQRARREGACRQPRGEVPADGREEPCALSVEGELRA